MKPAVLAVCALLLSSMAAAQSNATIELNLSASSAYIDGEQHGDSFIDSSVGFGYVATSDPIGIISYQGEAQRASFEDGEQISLTNNLSRRGNEFVLANTEGGVSAIEDRRRLFQEKRLEEVIEASIGFDVGAENIIRVVYLFPYEVYEFRGSQTGIDELLVQNRIHSGNETELVLRGD